MTTYADHKEPRVCIPSSSIQTIFADECPKVSATEVGLPIAQTAVFIIAGILLHGSSQVLQILSACIITALILTAVWIKRRHMIVVRIEEQDYNRIRNSSLAPHIFNFRERGDFFGHITFTSLDKDKPKNGNTMDSCAGIAAKLLRAYVRACVTASWLVMAVGYIKLKQHIRSDVSAARAMADEWEYELEQEIEPRARAHDATYVLVDAARFALQYGFIGRATKRIKEFFRLTNDRCECDRLEHECSDLHINPESDIGKKTF